MKFQPLASKTYDLLFEYNEPRYQEACEKMITKAGVQKLAKFSENWSYGVFVDGGTDMVYWNIYDSQVKATIDQMGLLKGIPIQVIVGREMGEKNKPYDTFQFIKDNVSYYSQQTQTAQPQQVTATSYDPSTKVAMIAKPPDPTEELDKRKRLMKWCIDTILEIWPVHANSTIFSELVPLVQSLHVEIRDKGIYPPKEETGIMKEAEQMDRDQPPPHSDDEAPF